MDASATSTDRMKTVATNVGVVIEVMARYGRSRAAGADNSAPAQLLEMASTHAQDGTHEMPPSARGRWQRLGTPRVGASSSE